MANSNIRICIRMRLILFSDGFHLKLKVLRHFKISLYWMVKASTAMNARITVDLRDRWKMKIVKNKKMKIGKLFIVFLSLEILYHCSFHRHVTLCSFISSTSIGSFSSCHLFDWSSIQCDSWIWKSIDEPNNMKTFFPFDRLKRNDNAFGNALPVACAKAYGVLLKRHSIE